MYPKELSIKEYTYELPHERIARYPQAVRDQSKLLIWRDSVIQETIYSHIADHIPENSLLVFNDTKVVEARLLFQKSSGGVIEIFCLEPHDQYKDITTAMMQKGHVLWKCLVGGAKKWKEGLLTRMIENGSAQIELAAKKIERRNDHYIIELSWEDDRLSFAELLHLAGAVPLPPYLERKEEASDKERYQTIYARYDGSVAAPTAGLHFTDKVFASLRGKSITHDFVTLHVGAGTFKPVSAATMQEHEMHSEFIDVKKACITNLLNHLPGRIIAVGTTSLRTMESLYWLGRKILLDPSIAPTDLLLEQWDAYDMAEENIDAAPALQALLNWMEANQLDRLLSKTQILIAPGYTFRIISGLITNFHQPNSTLLLLVAAITGEDWKKIYSYALKNDFRFLSYGDGSLLWLKKTE